MSRAGEYPRPRERRPSWVGMAASLAVVLAATTGVAPADTVASDVSVATADTYVVATKPTTNFGTRSTLKLDASPITRSYLSFYVGSSGTVVDATLKLHSPVATPVGFTVHPVADITWDERSMTYENAPAFASAVASSGPLSAGGWASIDVTSLVTGAGAISFALTTSTRTAFTLSSLQAGATAPHLVVRTSTADDLEPPTTPPDLAAVATGATRVHVSWGASQDNTAVAGYDVFRDDQLVATLDGVARSFSDTGLEPEREYAYGVEAFDGAGNRSLRAGPVSVTTAAPSVNPVVVAVGDIACDPSANTFNGGMGTGTACRQVSTSELALSLEPTAVLGLGDLQYACAGYEAFLQSYDPSWGRLRAITYPAPGNHEYGTSASNPTGTGCSPVADAAGYFSYFGAAAGNPSQGWYSFDIGAWHVIALNSNCSRIGGCGFTSPQGVWLQSDLAASDAACTLAFNHHPRFSSGPHGNLASMDKFWQLLHAGGGDVVLSGHDHLYERFAPLDPLQQPDPLGMRSFVVGTGGKEQNTVATVQPGSEVRIDDRFGVLEMTLADGSYSWRFMSTTEETPLDWGTGTCH